MWLWCLGMVDKIQIVCEWCEKEFELIPSLFERSKHHFCSKSCSAKWHTCKIKTFCTFCGAELSLTKSAYRRSKNHFCSHSCYGKWLARDDADKPKAICDYCGWVGDRDLVGATNILSVFEHGEPGRMAPPTGRIKYRQVDAWKGVKSRRAAGDSPVPVTEPCGTVGLGLASHEAGAMPGRTQLPLADSSTVRAATLKTGLASALAGADLNHLDLPLSLGD